MTAPRPKLRVVRSGTAPPADTDLEAFALAAAIHMGAHADLAGVTASTFALPAHAAIWGALTPVLARGHVPSPVLVAAQLRATEEFTPSVAAALESIALAVRTISDVSVREAGALLVLRSLRREFVVACQRVAGEGCGPVEDDEVWLLARAAELQRIGARARRIVASELRDVLGAAVDAALAPSLATAAGGNRGPAIPSGIAPLDALTGGFVAGETTLLSGRTGLGKSAFAGTVALNSLAAGVGVAWLQLEPSNVVARLAIADGKLDAGAFRHGTATEHEQHHLWIAADRLRNRPFLVLDLRSPTLAETLAALGPMVARARELGNGHVLVVVDYMQLINGRSAVGERANREEAVGEVGKALVEFGERERVAMYLLCQTNGEGEIRESRAVLQHAHNWHSLHSEKAKAPKDARSIGAHIEVRKQRNGPWPVNAAMWFYPRSVCFGDEELL